MTAVRTCRNDPSVIAARHGKESSTGPVSPASEMNLTPFRSHLALICLRCLAPATRVDIGGLVTRMTNLAGPPGVEACCGASRAAAATGVPALSLRGGRQGSRPPPGASAAERVSRMRVGIADGFVVQSIRHRVSDRRDRRIDRLVGLRVDRLVWLRVSARVGHPGLGSCRVARAAVRARFANWSGSCCPPSGPAGGCSQHADRVRAGA